MTEQNPQNPAPGYTGEEHPELFSTIPPQPSSLKPGQVSADKVKEFYEQGFLLLDKFFTDDELTPPKLAINELVDRLAHKLYDAGKIKNLYADHGFDDRLTKLEAEYPGANIILHTMGEQPDAFGNLWSNDRLLNLAEQLMGTADLAGFPAWNLRCKTPQSQAAVVPWHQDTSCSQDGTFYLSCILDSGYFDNSTYERMIITAWIPLIDTNEINGCLEVIRGAHKKGKIAKHVGCWRDTWYVSLEEEELSKDLGVDMTKDIVTCPVPYGGILLFTNFTPHRGLPNFSNLIRWSFDFRWQPAHCSSGMYGTKPSVVMRSSTDPNFKIDWKPFTSVNRFKRHFEMLNTVRDEFETSNPGPWMLKWPLIHENRHTDALKTVDRSDWKHAIYG